MRRGHVYTDKIHNCPNCLKEKHFQNLMHMSEGSRSNRPQTKSVPSQIGPSQIIVLLWSFFIVSLLFFTPGNHMSANFVVYYCQHAKLNIS